MNRISTDSLNRLSTRLLASFLLVLFITLVVIGFTLILFLRSRPVPIDETVSNLAASMSEINLRGSDLRIMVRELQNLPVLPPNTPPDEMYNLANLPSTIQFMEDTAEEVGFRLILLENDRVIYDTLTDDTLQLDFIERSALFRSNVPDGQNDDNRSFVERGVLDDNGTEWIFVGRRFNVPVEVPRPGTGDRGNNNQQPARTFILLVASARPEPTLSSIFDDFGNTFLLPLCQAGFIGLIVALLLSIWQSRSVARPLQNIARAAHEVAAGNMEEQVPETGPTEARVVARAFNNMVKRVNFTRQAQQDFLGSVTHDLRTPLTSIQGFSQAIMDGIATQPEAAHHAAEIIHEEAGRMNRLVTALLDLQKIQAGRMEMTRQAVEIDRLLQRVGENLAIKAGEYHIHLHVEIPHLTRIAGDGDRLAQVFTNLVDNALKHTDAGGHVWLRAKIESGGIRVEIQDTGEGIPVEDLPRIFERFYQVDKSRKRSYRGGAGLGLAITNEIVRAHNGHIQVQSQVGVGSQFTVWLPMLGHDKKTIIARRF